MRDYLNGDYYRALLHDEKVPITVLPPVTGRRRRGPRRTLGACCGCPSARLKAKNNKKKQTKKRRKKQTKINRKRNTKIKDKRNTKIKNHRKKKQTKKRR